MDKLQSVGSKILESKSATYTLCGAAAIGGTYAVYKMIGGDTGFRTSFLKLGNTGSLSRSDFKNGIDSYNEFFEQDHGKGVGERKFNTPKFVDTFYSLITDFYEYGWGQSFHFAPRDKGEGFDASIIRHEVKIAKQIGLEPGKSVLDAGCGVGGPMRNIVFATGGKVTGITINAYQVERCTAENIKTGASKLANVVQGSFLEMPFPDNHFDGCYCIEAACHAPVLEDLYKEIARVMKPGSHFATYEWLRTDKYDSNNDEHVKLVDMVAEGNALPAVRTYEDCLAAAKAAGLELVYSRDEALHGDIGWQVAMKTARRAAFLTDFLTKIMESIGWAPKGTWATHQMLLRAAYALEVTGDMGIFTPMYLLTFRKPTA
mmetsp:Transcript_31767/g.38384  ORF Transcript_31767/g.38384 Transcript_31767/m.38384 type:complete len:374 (-) Transcript_31767:498-1619(-)|eukprot:CAMPEP_0197849488 /NCGR_PEP_ID=MMETSP1438-20131217/12310_1 /TAXON_ID=1461541 /ORGANISM="Pterosperma sp., Strain CCMP1384" /LENGTH=373 /DNA_ID=CAMNT_0043462207 /DNA_START=125 /DNA_END=1246 /DNA_ORIENTATION=+